MQPNKTFFDAMKGMTQGSKEVSVALQALIMGLGMATPRMADKPGTRAQTKKTQRGATHLVNPVFRSRNRLGIAPSDFRRQHLGVSVKNMRKAAARSAQHV